MPRLLSTAAVAILVLGVGGLVVWGASKSQDQTGRRLRGLALAGLVLLPLGAIVSLVLLGLFDIGWWYIVQGYYSNPNFGLVVFEH